MGVRFFRPKLNARQDFPSIEKQFFLTQERHPRDSDVLLRNYIYLLIDSTSAAFKASRQTKMFPLDSSFYIK
jgi:hypothetical protein